jgi:hypothetical protein
MALLALMIYSYADAHHLPVKSSDSRSLILEPPDDLLTARVSHP